MAKPGVSSATIAMWGDAMCDALRCDRRGLVALLRGGNEVTRDVAEFLAWLLDERKGGRPKLPEKFKLLKQFSHPLFDPVMDFYHRQTAWHYLNPGRRFPHKVIRDKVAACYGVDTDQLDTEIRRSARSSSKLGG